MDTVIVRITLIILIIILYPIPNSFSNQGNKTKNDLIKLYLIPSHEKIEVGQNFELTALIQSKINKKFSLKLILPPEKQVKLLKGAKTINNVQVTEKIGHINKYIFATKEPGNYKITLVIMDKQKIINTKTTETIIVESQTSDTVKAIWGLVPVIFGAILGVLLTGISSLVTMQWQKYLDKSRKKNWLRNTLPVYLEEAKIKLDHDLPVEYQSWFSRIYEEGYLFVINEINDVKKSGINLTQLLSQVNCNFQKYEHARAQNDIRVELKIKKELIKSIQKLCNLLYLDRFAKAD